MTNTLKNRIEWIDEFKGFVLLLVCLYHIDQSFANIDMGMEHLSAFRMSAFFFISGVLFSTRNFSDIKSYVNHKTKVLLLPYIFLSLFFLFLDPVIYNFTLYVNAPKMVVLNTYPVIYNTWDYIYWNLLKIFIAGKSSIGSGTLWFVFTLYSVSLIFFCIQKICKQNKFIIAIIALFSLSLGWFFYRNHIRLPFGIERDLTTLFFFSCGWIFKDFIKEIAKCNGIYKMLVILFVSLSSFILYAFFEHPNANFSIMNNDLGKSFWNFFACSVFGICGLVSAFVLFSHLPLWWPIKYAKGILRNISRNALVILAVHWWILLVLRLIYKEQFDKIEFVYISFLICCFGTILLIPLFRCKLYMFLQKEKISFKESLCIK